MRTELWNHCRELLQSCNDQGKPIFWGRARGIGYEKSALDLPDLQGSGRLAVSPLELQSIVTFMRKDLLLTGWLLAIALAGCSKRATPPSSQSTQETNISSPAAANLPTASSTISRSESASPKIDAATLLTGKEIESVQGTPFTDTKSTERSDGGVIVSQCYFALAKAADSISLSVTQKGTGSDARDPEQVWNEAFHQAPGKTKASEEEKDSTSPEKIIGLGEEAFWVKNRVGGELYVLKGDAYIRISVGGAGNEATKIEKSKALAEMILKRL
jgi:hypothetical protein